MRETDDDSNGRPHVFELLQHRIRRAVPLTLRSREEPMVLETLAEQVSTASHDDETVAIVHHHLHLPTLADTGLVSYERANREVEPRRESLLEPNRTPTAERIQ